MSAMNPPQAIARKKAHGPTSIPLRMDQSPLKMIARTAIVQQVYANVLKNRWRTLVGVIQNSYNENCTN